jgi:hypothetical protein
MRLPFEQSAKQIVAVAVFSIIGLGVYHYSNRPDSIKNVAASPGTPVTTPASSSSAIEIYSPPHQAFTPVQLDPMKQTDRAMAEADAKVRAAPDQPDSYVELSEAYMQKARETADAGYLLRAEAACSKAFDLRPGFYDAMQVVPWIYNSQHRFDEGAAAARAARDRIPADAWNYGTLGDALLELGDYDGARVRSNVRLPAGFGGAGAGGAAAGNHGKPRRRHCGDERCGGGFAVGPSGTSRVGAHAARQFLLQYRAD